MEITVHIRKRGIKRYYDYDEQGNPIGGERVRFFFTLPDYPMLSGFVIMLDYPCTKAQVDAALYDKVVEIKDQVDRNAVVRQQAENMGYTKVIVNGEECFETSVEVT